MKHEMPVLHLVREEVSLKPRRTHYHVEFRSQSHRMLSHLLGFDLLYNHCCFEDHEHNDELARITETAELHGWLVHITDQEPK